MDRVHAHAVRSRGDGPAVVLSHGLGGSQEHWDELAAQLADSHRVVTYTLAGSPGADPAIFSPVHHSSIFGYATDLIELVDQAGLAGAVFVGHSTAGMAGAVAAAVEPGILSRIVMIGSSPRYLDDPDTGYRGGFDRPTVDAILDAIESDFTGWAAEFGPAMVGVTDRPDLVDRFRASLLGYDRDIAHWSFRAVLTSDVRRYVPHVTVPTLLLETERDPIVPAGVTRWLGDRLPDGRILRIGTVGHLPHLTAPAEVLAAVQGFLAEG